MGCCLKAEGGEALWVGRGISHAYFVPILHGEVRLWLHKESNFPRWIVMSKHCIAIHERKGQKVENCGSYSSRQYFSGLHQLTRSDCSESRERVGGFDKFSHWKGFAEKRSRLRSWSEFLFVHLFNSHLSRPLQSCIHLHFPDGGRKKQGELIQILQ